MTLKLSDDECAQDAFCNMEGYAYAGWSMFAICYLLGVAGIVYLWMQRPQRKGVGTRLPSLSESLIENNHSPDVSMKKSRNGSDSSNSSQKYAQVNGENIGNNDEDTVNNDEGTTIDL